MNRFLCLVICCGFWALVIMPPTLGAAEDPEEVPRLPLAMEVVLKKPGKHLYELHVHLTNMSDEPVHVDIRDLPWNPTDGPTWLSASRMDAEQSPIKQDVPLGRFGSRLVRLVPGETIEGKVALNPRIPSLLDDIEQAGVQLQWDCPPSDLRFVCKTGSPNSLTIPKGDSGQPDVYAIDHQACLTLESHIGLIDIPQGHEVLFLLASESIMTNLDAMKSLLLQVEAYVQRCHPGWTNSWAVSFVTDEKFAGFLSEGENRRYFAEGLWQEANIGQYSSQIHTLFRFPWIKKRADTVYLSLFPFHPQGDT
ncbi:MAG TPA: hypothetical protein PKK23_09825 [Nitrospirales bacterium]|nr:hypothetical protein [Nitrospirales bacterium]